MLPEAKISLGTKFITEPFKVLVNALIAEVGTSLHFRILRLHLELKRILLSVEFTFLTKDAAWTAAEEQLITETMAGGLSRIAAIQNLRRKWLIGETAPPGWKARPTHADGESPIPDHQRRCAGAPR